MFYSSVTAALAVLASTAAIADATDRSDRGDQIASTPTGSLWYLDRATVKTDGSVSSAWLDMDHSRDKTEAARHSRALITVDCAAHRFHWVQFFQYRPNGSPMPERVPPNVGMDIAPGSPIEAVEHEICQGNSRYSSRSPIAASLLDRR
jgi:hypothetical protein